VGKDAMSMNQSAEKDAQTQWHVCSMAALRVNTMHPTKERMAHESQEGPAARSDGRCGNMSRMNESGVSTCMGLPQPVCRGKM